MNMPLKKRKPATVEEKKSGPPSRKPVQEEPEGPVALLDHTGDRPRPRPVDGAERRTKTGKSKNVASVRPSQPDADVPKNLSAGESLNPDPAQLPQTKPKQEGDGPVISFTIQPTEEDLKRMESLVQGKKGHIKRPMNAYMVWSHIHRRVLHKARPDVGMPSVHVQLGNEWSKLSEEQQRPYFEAAHKLKMRHQQQFPDYVYCPKKKKYARHLDSEQEAGEADGQASLQPQDLSVSSVVSQDVHFAQPKLPDLWMNWCPAVLPYKVDCCPHSFFGPYDAVGFQMHQSRRLYEYGNASISVEEVACHRYTALQRDTITQYAVNNEAMQPQYDLRHNSQEDLYGNVRPSENLQQLDVSTSSLEYNWDADDEDDEDDSDADIDVVTLP